MTKNTDTRTILDDDRIAGLRSRVMADVDADVRRRGRRARLVAGTAAVCVVALGLGAGIAALGGDSTDHDRLVATEPGSGGEPLPAPDGFAESDSMEFQVGPQAADGTTLSVEPTADLDRQEIVTGTASLVADVPADAASDFATWVESQGGRVDQRSDRDGITELTVRVPAADVNAAIEQLRELGDVESTSVHKLDVTSDVVDLDARIAALQESIARLTAILASATTTSEVVEAESNLTYRQAELDGLVAQRNALGDQIDLSTLDVTFRATPEAVTVEPGGFIGGLKTGWDALVTTVNNLVTGAGVAAPWLGVLALAGGIWWLSRRIRRPRT